VGRRWVGWEARVRWWAGEGQVVGAGGIKAQRERHRGGDDMARLRVERNQSNTFSGSHCQMVRSGQPTGVLIPVV
jgi:hypothetical protein